MSQPFNRRRMLSLAAAGAAAVPLAGLAARPAHADPASNWINPPRVYIDAAAGGSNLGATSGFVWEKNVTLAIATKTWWILNRYYPGIETRLSRSSDVTRSVSSRIDEANSWGANLFVTIHTHASPSPSGWDAFTIATSDESTIRARNLIAARTLISMARVTTAYGFQFPNRGFYTGTNPELTQTRAPAVWTNNLCIGQSMDTRFLAEDSFLAEIARGHALGIASWV